MSFARYAALLFVLLGVAAVHAAPPSPEKSPVEPDESLRYFQLPEDLAIELVAAEPEVVDPIDIRFDEHGRMYVVEMRDYPLGASDGGKPLSRIKLLEDRNGDGRYETAHLFAEHLPFATGVQPWKGGVIVTMAGRVAYLKDTNGDHKADVDETWFTGFAQENSQLRANHPRFAHDNHIYIANGLRGGKIVDVRPDSQTKEPINISGRDFRFDPRGTLAEAVTGVGQYGLCFDDFGNRFVCQNRHPVQHVVFEERDLKKSKHYTPPAVMNDVAAAAENSKLFPLTKTWTTSNLHENTFTAACGVNIYRGNALPETYRGLAFTCDPTGNLVHAERMEPWGPTFRSKPLYEDKEFLASTDEWFRPVSIENGPDGALYVVDMYRAVIEHPDFVPDELRRRPDQRFGDDRGRIYRIVKKGHPRGENSLPGKANGEQLVQLLAHENAWQRETAQRLLIEKEDNTIESQIAPLLKQREPQTVFQALWTLHGLNLLRPDHIELVLQAFGSVQRPIRPSLSRFVDGFGNLDAKTRNNLLSRENYGYNLSPLGPLTTDEARFKAWRVTFRDDPWTRYDFLLCLERDWLEICTELMRDHAPVANSEEHFYALVKDLARLGAMHEEDSSLQEMLSKFSATAPHSPQVVQAWLIGLSEGLARRSKRLADFAKDASIASFLDDAAAQAAEQANERKIALRTSAVETLQAINTSKSRESLTNLTRDPSQTIRLAAIKAVLSFNDEAASKVLLDRARSESPLIKRAILEGLATRPATLALLLDALEAGELQPADIDPTLVPRLVNAGDPQLKARAKKLLAPPVDADRQKTLALYTAALKGSSDPKEGRTLFEKNCATCHKVGDVGVNVAPDISDSRTKTAEQILLDVLHPNRAVDGNYVGYVLSTADGKTLSGVISAETSQAVTLKQPGGQTVVVSKSDIEEMLSTGKSLMPEGLERTITPEQMAHVVSYIKNWRYLDGRTPASSVKR